MKLIFLGTNGWYDTVTGNTISILLKTDKYNIIFDAGTGIYKLDRYVSFNENTDLYLFLSHFHLDHIIGYHTICKFSGFNSLKIFGPEGTKKCLSILAEKPFSVPLADLRYKVELYELPEDLSKVPFKIKTLTMLHADLTLGYRLEIEDKIITYCPDTGYCENALTLSKNSDILMAECSHKPGQYNEAWPHLNPETAARIAKEGGAKKLFLVHMNPMFYETHKDREDAASMAGKIFPGTVAAKDDMEIEL